MRPSKFYRIILCRLPSHTSQWLQPCDQAIFGPLKSIGKEHFTSLCSPARETAFTVKNIKAGFAACGLVPFNPDRVLRDIPEPPIEPIFPKANEITIQHCLQDELIRTPATPVWVEALASLENIIIQQDSYSLDKSSPALLKCLLPRVLFSRTKFNFCPRSITKPSFDDRPSQSYLAKRR